MVICRDSGCIAVPARCASNPAKTCVVVVRSHFGDLLTLAVDLLEIR